MRNNSGTNTPNVVLPEEIAEGVVDMELEYLVADARTQGATTLITTGAVQSNHARMTAAAACVAGMRCVLVLTTTETEPELSGNLLLDRMYGAEVRLVPSIDPMFAVGNDAPVVAAAVDEEMAAGRTPYMIPVGGSSAVGAVSSRAAQGMESNTRSGATSAISNSKDRSAKTSSRSLAPRRSISSP